MESRYDHIQTESEMYSLWEQATAFAPASDSSKTTAKPFTIIMPPPNANDPLHIGHAMFVSLEDTMTRFHRMRGDNTVWIPGTDHAGIETQFVYEKKLKKQGKSRFDFDRQTLFNDIMAYVKENSDVAVNQIKKLGASADWSRFTFTLDPAVVEFVTGTFQKLADDNLVYRDLQLVNFCVNCGTSFSELEVNHIDQTSPLYYVRYRMADNPSVYITLATTRPEPIWADTHLAVHPDNKKTKHLIGKKVLNPLTDAEMEIIADDFVDPEFGTGIVKLTPAHDFNDFAAAKRHNLPVIIAVDRRGKMTEGAGKYAGLNSKAAREAVVTDLQAKTSTDYPDGLIEKIDTNYQNRIGTCYKCGRVLEPLPLPQFFIRVNDGKKSLTKAALKALDDKATIVHGAGREKILRHWLETLHDWNISRQTVWGIRIPVWYEVTGNEDKITVSFINAKKELTQGVLSQLLKDHSIDEIEAGLQQLFADSTVPYQISVKKPHLSRDSFTEKDGSVNEKSMSKNDSKTENNPKKTHSTTQNELLYLPETDTFDTWFSSAQWPVVTLKTTKPGDFETFYPTTVMETGYDILPFWVMRMMLMGLYITGKTPFSEVYLHGLVRDAKGQKMSKSKGNVINPLEIVEKFGADALRMALVIRSTPGLDKSVSDQDFKAMRNFSNKIWNAARFIALQDENTSHEVSSDSVQTGELSAAVGDAVFMEKLATIAAEVTKHLEERRLGLAADVTYNEFWHWFCDQCIEDQKQGKISLKVLQEGLHAFLHLLHPFMPFVTEKIWQELRANDTTLPELLIKAPWPQQQ
jgi:valyl-tRNA synthetase